VELYLYVPSVPSLEGTALTLLYLRCYSDDFHDIGKLAAEMSAPDFDVSRIPH